MLFHGKMSTFWKGSNNLQEPQKLAQKVGGSEKRRNGIVKTVEGRDKRRSEGVKSGKSEKPKPIFMRLESPIFGHLDEYFNNIQWKQLFHNYFSENTASKVLKQSFLAYKRGQNDRNGARILKKTLFLA